MTRPYWLPILPLSLVVFGCNEAANSNVGSPLDSATPATFNSTSAPTVEYSLPDMMCEDGCAFAVKDILEKQPGVRDVQVDFGAKTATVAVDQNTFSSERTLAELVDKGFDNSKLADDSSTTAETVSSEVTAAEDE